MKGGRGGGELEAPLKKKKRRGVRWTDQLMDRGLLSAALTAQLSLRRSVLVGQSGRPGVTLAASGGTLGVIGGDITPGRNVSE